MSREGVQEQEVAAAEPVRCAAPPRGYRYPEAPTPTLARLLVPALASALLLWLGYFPVAWGWLGWVALVPLLTLVRTEARPSRVYLAAWAAGLAFYWPALQWMRVADPRMVATWALLATYCSVYVPLAIYLLRRLERSTPLPLLVTVPVVWTALEGIRAHFLGGFAWYFLGHTQHALLPVIQVADLGGAYAVTFVVAAVNAFLFELLAARPGWRRLLALPETPDPAVPRWHAGAVALLLAGVLGYGAVRLGQEEFTPGPRVALVQGNLDQRLKNAAAAAADPEDLVGRIVRHYAELTDQAVMQRPDLIVWPETSYPEDWIESPAGRPDPYSAKLAQTVAQRWQTPVLLGLNVQERDPGDALRRYNSALLIRPDAQVAGRYDKIHRVPFGEYVPLREELPWMNAFAPYDFEYSIRAGTDTTRFPLGPLHFGVVICYEDTDPLLARQYVRATGGRPLADFLVNISNDGWFDGTSEHEEHLAICRFRAVECRRAVARSVNMGVSAVIDGSGRVIALPGPSWEASKKVAGVVTAVVPLDRRGSFYAAWGDWLPWGCWVVVGVGLVAGFRRPRAVAGYRAV